MTDREQRSKPRPTMPDVREPRPRQPVPIGLYLALGVAFGTSVGLVLDNLVIGIALGLALGTLVGFAKSQSRR